jgi:membrane-associated HD superfamily phosphohydrolase
MAEWRGGAVATVDSVEAALRAVRAMDGPQMAELMERF